MASQPYHIKKKFDKTPSISPIQDKHSMNVGLTTLVYAVAKRKMMRAVKKLKSNYLPDVISNMIF